MRTVEERFWEKVRIPADVLTGCWEWTGRRQRYGQFAVRVAGEWKKVLAHRFSWSLLNGDAGQLCVLHRCDNPPCVNPAHLFLGTQLENIADRVEKGRSDSGNRRLKQSEVEAIRALYARGGLRQRDLAARFSISQTHVGAIVRRTRRN